MAAGILAAVMTLWAVAAAVGAFPRSLTLERAFPVKGNRSLELKKLVARDRMRHGRMLQSKDVIDFPVEGSYDPFTVGLVSTGILDPSLVLEHEFDSLLFYGCKKL